MLNVLIPIINNAKKYQKILESLGNLNNVNIYIGIVSSQKQYLNILEGTNMYFVEFEDGSHREEIINSLQKYIGDGAILIMRKPITVNEFNAFVNTKKDIMTCRKNLSSIKLFFMNIWQKILKLCLGVKLYDGDTSVIYFGEDISSVILNSSNLSYNSRVDRWKGVEQGTVLVEGDAVKTEIDKKANLNSLLFSLVALLIGVVVTTVVCLFSNVNAIIGLLLFCLDTICLSIIAFLIVVTVFNNSVGKKQYGYAVEIENSNEEEL